MSSSYSSLDWVCLTRPISLCVDLFVYFLFIQHMCYLTVTRRGGSDGIEALSWRPYIPSLLWHCWLGHLTRRRSPAVPIKTKICVISHLADVITYAKFQVDISRGYDFTGGGGVEVSIFLLNFAWALQQCSAAAMRCLWCVWWNIKPYSTCVRNFSKIGQPLWYTFDGGRGGGAGRSGRLEVRSKKGQQHFIRPSSTTSWPNEWVVVAFVRTYRCNILHTIVVYYQSRRRRKKVSWCRRESSGVEMFVHAAVFRGRLRLYAIVSGYTSSLFIICGLTWRKRRRLILITAGSKEICCITLQFCQFSSSRSFFDYLQINVSVCMVLHCGHISAVVLWRHLNTVITGVWRNSSGTPITTE